MKAIITLLLIIVLSGCAGHFAMSSKMNNVNVGMSRSEVVSVMGQPNSHSSIGDSEDLVYVLNTSAWDTAMPEPYVVRLIDGKVSSFGRLPDMPTRKVK